MTSCSEICRKPRKLIKPPCSSKLRPNILVHQAHHLIGWGYESTRFYIPNGLCLSRDVHDQYHSFYTRDRATIESFESFLAEYYPHIKARLWRDDGYTGNDSNLWNLDNNQPNPSNDELSNILNQSFKHKERMFEVFKTKNIRPYHE